MYTLETCAREWEAAGQHGTIEERMERAKRWLPYYDYLAQKQLGSPYVQEEDPDGFVAALVRSGFLRETDSVLDVGAGTGGYTLELALHCKSVTALEPGTVSLDVLKDRAGQCGVRNVQCVCDLWETFQPEARYDLVFSSMCPAICNPDELRRMEALSRRDCCLITVTRGSTDRHRGAMMAQLGIRPKGGMVTEALHYYNALYLMGRQPNVLCRTVHSEYDIDAETVLAQYPIYFRIFGVDEEASRAFLKDYLAKTPTAACCTMKAQCVWR